MSWRTKDIMDQRRRNLLLIYVTALASLIAVGLSTEISSLRTVLLLIATVATALTAIFLLRFLRSNDEREQQINYRALTFGFCGTLILSLIVGILQLIPSGVPHSISWLGIPVLMLVLWSIGLILYSWRYR